MTDPIVDEVRRIRDAHAAQFNYDLDSIFLAIKERERMAGHKFVHGVARLSNSHQSSQPTNAASTIQSEDRVENEP